MDWSVGMYTWLVMALICLEYHCDYLIIYWLLSNECFFCFSGQQEADTIHVPIISTRWSSLHWLSFISVAISPYLSLECIVRRGETHTTIGLICLIGITFRHSRSQSLESFLHSRSSLTPSGRGHSFGFDPVSLYLNGSSFHAVFVLYCFICHFCSHITF